MERKLDFCFCMIYIFVQYSRSFIVPFTNKYNRDVVPFFISFRFLAFFLSILFVCFFRPRLLYKVMLLEWIPHVAYVVLLIHEVWKIFPERCWLNNICCPKTLKKKTMTFRYGCFLDFLFFICAKCPFYRHRTIRDGFSLSTHNKPDGHSPFQSRGCCFHDFQKQF